MNWQKGPIIGRGSSATVSLATTISGDIFAVKSSELPTLQKEQQLLSNLKSPHIINYIGFDLNYVNNVPMYNLFMEYAAGGTISDEIKKQGGFLDENLIRSYTRQILLGLDYLHSNNLVHCDIKCSNILVFEDCVKIGDLGCAKSSETETETETVFSGTPVFMAPEVARGEEQSFAADIWALGCSVIEMATGCNPWPEMKNPVSGLYRIGFSDDLPLFPAWFSAEGKDFLEKCIRRNGKERWTAKELLEHPFVNSNSNSGSKTIERNSPSSILYQGFWDSVEESEGSLVPTGFGIVSGDSPVERIRQLVEATETTSCFPWVDDDDEEDWITVRINDSARVSLDIPEQGSYFDVEEDDDVESTGVDFILFTNLFVEEDDLWFDRMLLRFDVDESSGANVDVSRFVDLKNMNDNNCFTNWNFIFTLLGSLFLV